MVYVRDSGGNGLMFINGGAWGVVWQYDTIVDVVKMWVVSCRARHT